MKIAKGFRQLLKEDYHSEPLTLESLTECLKDAFKTKVKEPWTGIQYYTGFLEDGTEYEYWVINGVMTGRGGYEMFLKEVRKQSKEYGLTKTNRKHRTSFRRIKKKTRIK